MTTNQGGTMGITRAEISQAIVDFETDRALARNGHGRGMWMALRASPDGSTHTSCEASACYSESEYYGRTPHTVTIRVANECYSPDPDSGVEWEECDPGERGEFLAARGGNEYVSGGSGNLGRNALRLATRLGCKLSWHRLGNSLAEPIKIEDGDVDQAIEECLEAGIEIEDT